jgi:outer membrane protein TolC
MRRLQPALAVLCVILTLGPVSTAQDRTPTIESPGGVLGRYKPSQTPAIALSNSSRLEQLIRAGNLYLSLQDAIALALENNLDIDRARYSPLIAQTDVKRAQAGGALRGVSTQVTIGPSSAGGGLSLNAFSNGSAAGGGNASAVGGAGGVNGVISQLGPSIPNLDPVLTSTISWGHFTAPQTTAFLYGTTSLVSTQRNFNFAVSQGFLSGGTAQLSFTNQIQAQNSGRSDINPTTTGQLDLLVTQPLLQGFGFAINNRQIVIAKNNLRVSDLAFQLQVIATVSNIVGLYFDLVSFIQNVKVAQQSLAVSQKLYDDNMKQVEVGTLAPITIVQAKAEIAARRQDLVVAQTNVLQQETIIKQVLTRDEDPAVSAAHIIPTDSIQMPATEPIQPIQDLIGTALSARPELSQSQINLDNSKITLKADKNALLPSVNLFLEATNLGQSGPINGLPPIGNNLRSVDPFFVGGYGTFLSQVFGRSFPDYRAGVNLTIPLRNRAAQADYAHDELSLRQSEIDLQKQIKQIRADVQNAVIGLQQARARYDAAVEQRALEEQTLDAEQKKYALGASTVYNVIQIQRDLATAQGSEVTAQSQYAHARVNLELATGQVLPNYQVSITEAQTGHVARPPAPPPVLTPQPQGSMLPLTPGRPALNQYR